MHTNKEQTPDEAAGVLVADTNQGASVLAALLRDSFETSTATTWEEAVRLLQEKRPRIVVVGYHFDETHPYRLIRHVREQAPTRGLPVLLVRGLAVQQGPYVDEEIRSSYRDLGANGYVTLDKTAPTPEDAERLRKEVGELLRSARGA